MCDYPNTEQRNHSQKIKQPFPFKFISVWLPDCKITQCFISLWVFTFLKMWPCSFSMEEVGFVFLPLESGLALGLALANRMWWKWLFPAPSLWFRGPCVLLSLSFCHNHNPSWPAAGQGTDRRVLCGPRSMTHCSLHTHMSPAEIYSA